MHHTLGVYPQSTKDLWKYEICRTKLGKGFETTILVLPRLYNIKFDIGLIDELIFFEMSY